MILTRARASSSPDSAGTAEVDRRSAPRCGNAARPGGGAAVFGDQPLEELQYPLFAAGAGVVFEFVDRAGEHRVIGSAGGGEANRRVPGRHSRLGGMEQLFVQLLARAQANELDLDV